MRKVVRKCRILTGLVTLFDGDRRTNFSGMYCVAAGILEKEVDREWEQYVQEQKERRVQNDR